MSLDKEEDKTDDDSQIEDHDLRDRVTTESEEKHHHEASLDTTLGCNEVIPSNIINQE